MTRGRVKLFGRLIHSVSTSELLSLCDDLREPDRQDDAEN